MFPRRVKETSQALENHLVVNLAKLTDRQTKRQTNERSNGQTDTIKFHLEITRIKTQGLPYVERTSAIIIIMLNPALSISDLQLYLLLLLIDRFIMLTEQVVSAYGFTYTSELGSYWYIRKAKTIATTTRHYLSCT